MSDDTKAVPEPGEAGRDDDEEIHYHEVDETNVRDTDRPKKPRADQARPPGAGD